MTIDPKLVDWSDCALVERNPLNLSGVPIVKHTRVQADSIVENFESGSPVEKISGNVRIEEEIIRELPAYAAKDRNPWLSTFRTTATDFSSQTRA